MLSGLAYSSFEQPEPVVLNSAIWNYVSMFSGLAYSSFKQPEPVVLNRATVYGIAPMRFRISLTCSISQPCNSTPDPENSISIHPTEQTAASKKRNAGNLVSTRVNGKRQRWNVKEDWDFTLPVITNARFLLKKKKKKKKKKTEIREQC